MSVVALASARHSPGVTTATLLAAAAWPRPVLVLEADPAGGDLVCWCRLRSEPNLLTLAAVARSRVEPADTWANAQPLAGASSVRAVVAPVDPRQADAALAALIRAGLPSALGGLPDTDVLVDVGRLGPHSPALGLLLEADVAVLVCRPRLNEIDHLHTRAAWLKAEGVSDLRLVVVGHGPWSAAEAARAAGIPKVGAVLPDDPRGAAILAGEDRGGRSLGRSALWRSAATLVEGLAPPALSADGGPEAGEAGTAGAGPASGHPEREGVAAWP